MKIGYNYGVCTTTTHFASMFTRGPPPLVLGVLGEFGCIVIDGGLSKARGSGVGHWVY